MRNIKYAIVILLLAWAWLSTSHYTPWPTFSSEVLTFLSASLLIIFSLDKNIYVPKVQFLLFIFPLIPLIQYFFGQVVYLSNVVLSFAYFLFFSLMIVYGYSLSIVASDREKIFQILCYMFLIVGIISGGISILQWLNMNYLLGDLAYLQKGSRPYANFAQPNNFSTFLFLSLFSCLYFYERKLIQSKYLFLIGLFIVFNIVLAQSRTALLVSGFIIFYFFLKKNNVVLRFSFKQLVIWNVIFISLLFLIPLITPFVGHITAQPDMVLRNTVERASSGDIRLDMWQQMIAAILHQPWWGYGWNQTGLAQYYITDTFQVSLWYKSAHNMILDLLVWNGLILGGLILLYFAAWLLWLNKGVKDNISIIATLMVCAILIHGMLEFPLHYAYFLLPAGFLLGIIQAQYTNLPSLKVNGRVFAVIGLITIVGALVTTRDYFLYKEQSVLASKTEALTVDQQHTMQKQIWLITQFKERVWWIGLDPKTEMTEQQLADLERMVANLASKYDLHKYAQVLAFNGKEQEAKHQLWILKTLHKQHIEYDDLLK